MNERINKIKSKTVRSEGHLGGEQSFEDEIDDELEREHVISLLKVSSLAALDQLKVFLSSSFSPH